METGIREKDGGILGEWQLKVELTILLPACACIETGAIPFPLN